MVQKFGQNDKRIWNVSSYMINSTDFYTSVVFVAVTAIFFQLLLKRNAFMITHCFSTSLPPASTFNLLLQIPQQIYLVGLQQQDKAV
jgi:hypothetical protein